MRLLLDTHAFLWWIANDARLGAGARQAIALADVVAVSAASAWEIAIKKQQGRLRAPEDFVARLDQHSFLPLEITVAHALRAGALDLHHRDPFDRMLVAQAQLEGLTIVTRDPKFAAYGVPTIAA